MDIAAPELRKLIHGMLCHGIIHSRDGQGDERLIGMEPGIPVAQVIHLQMLDGAQGRDIPYCNAFLGKIQPTQRKNRVLQLFAALYFNE